MGFTHTEPLDLDKVEPICNVDYKPSGGLWISPIKGGQSLWDHYCERHSFRHRGISNVDEVTLRPDAKVIRIHSPADLKAVVDRYPTEFARTRGGFDFEAASEHFDAIWLTDAGENRCKYSEPSLYSWDLESVLVFSTRAVHH